MKRLSLFLLGLLVLNSSAGPLLLQPQTSNWFRNTHNAKFTTSDVVSFGNTFDKAHTDAWSISFWIEMTATAGQQNIVRKALANVPGANSYRGYQIIKQPAGNILLFLINTYGSNFIQLETRAAPLADLEPHFVVVTVDGSHTSGGVAVYADGVSLDFTVAADVLTSTISTTAPLTVGSDAADATNLAAYFDELLLWNRVLTAAEVALLYGRGRIIPPQRIADFATSAEHWYRFEAVTDTYNGTIYDRKGSANGTPTAQSSFLVSNIFLDLLVFTPNKRHVSQRSGTTGTIPIVGDDAVTFDTVEAKATPRSGMPGTLKDWTTIQSGVDHGPFSGSLTGVDQGWYDVSVRTKKAGSVVGGPTVVARVGIGETFVIAGQSNVANSAEVTKTPTSDMHGAYDWVNGKWQTAADPNPGATFDGPGGTPWTPFINKLVTDLSVPIGITNTGYGGTFAADWLPVTATKFLRLQAALQAMPNARAVLWGQGEAEGAVDTNAALYESQLHTIIDGSRVVAGRAIPWLIAQETICNNPSNTNITAVQNTVGTTYTACFAGPNLDLVGSGDRYSNCHWDDSGQTTVGEAWATSVKTAFGW